MWWEKFGERWEVEMSSQCAHEDMSSWFWIGSIPMIALSSWCLFWNWLFVYQLIGLICLQTLSAWMGIPLTIKSNVAKEKPGHQYNTTTSEIAPALTCKQTTIYYMNLWADLHTLPHSHILITYSSKATDCHWNSGCTIQQHAPLQKNPWFLYVSVQISFTIFLLP
jgi:hypothetical protein